MLAFIHIHKAAGQTVQAILASSFGRFHCDVEPWSERIGDKPIYVDDLRRLQRFYPGLKSIAGHHIKPCHNLRSQVPDIQFFTLLRDPIQRTASNFQYAVQKLGKKDLIFEKWIEDEWHHNRQTKMMVESEDVGAAIQIIKDQNIYVGLTERFDESMLMLNALIEKRLNISYERINVASDNHLAQQIMATPRIHQMIVDVNRADLSLYDFVTKELYPTYQQAYGKTLQNDLERYRNSHGAFNRHNIRLSRLMRYSVYKPLLFLYRRSNKSRSRYNNKGLSPQKND